MLCIVALLTLLLCSQRIFAQSAKSIQGDITDEKGNKIPGATVLIKGTKTGTSSDEKGGILHWIISFEIKKKPDLLRGFSGSRVREYLCEHLLRNSYYV
jgi:hypothetical protein